mmetsp:Transcript_10102/g.24897  ORF Transcript_10102/g.24897 Transcript_10102/m.24897 type:complete len:236 (-) Transcript_10102:386-1093(-)|eukprot:CAMPEP_0181367446 /NCGR_PEP_ID=MMETSP1106-20121128/11407_1 /TAXON_ID=81844 /ORGANISM="Mantoniella antarctica, Strain SL-175" /LENGTH=235 /DNA_ID=CAMNT_0023483193 /DNA_START=149 /DNA_END=856 /DNA_ORIENTATION=-
MAASLATPACGSLMAAAAAPRRHAAPRRGAVVRAAGFEMPAEYKKVTPLADRVLVKIAAAETKTTGGIILAESAQRKPTSGDVFEFGADCLEVAKGKTVLYNKFGIGCTDIEMGGDSYIMIKEGDLIGTFPSSGATAADIPQMTPMGDRVLLRSDEASAITAGGIMLTEGAIEKPCTATVLAVGPGKKGEDGVVKPMSIKADDKVMYFKYAGDKMYDTEGKEYVVLHENDILATF